MPTAVRQLASSDDAAALDQHAGVSQLPAVLGFQLSSLRFARQERTISDVEFAYAHAKLMKAFVSDQEIANPKLPSRPSDARSRTGGTSLEGIDALCARRAISRASSLASSPRAAKLSGTGTGSRTCSSLTSSPRMERRTRSPFSSPGGGGGSPFSTPRSPSVVTIWPPLSPGPTPNLMRGGAVGGYWGKLLPATSPATSPVERAERVPSPVSTSWPPSCAVS